MGSLPPISIAPSAIKVLGLALAAEPQFLQLDQRERGEVVIQDRGLNAGRLQARLRPQLPADQTHLGQAPARPLRGRRDDDRAVLEVPGPLRRRHHQRDTAVGLLTAVQQPQRLSDPPRILVVLNGDRLLVEVGLRVVGGVLAVGDRNRTEVLTRRPGQLHVAFGDHLHLPAGVERPCGYENELSTPVESAFSTNRS
jgi:hypothetical protein